MKPYLNKPTIWQKTGHWMGPALLAETNPTERLQKRVASMGKRLRIIETASHERLGGVRPTDIGAASS